MRLSDATFLTALGVFIPGAFLFLPGLVFLALVLIGCGAALKVSHR